ncbi:MAG: DUF4037 domain-containing protein, partial [Clostridiales bacterium]|nr:DUF4037 domain-containing protein [Clostridiales bacterium]
MRGLNLSREYFESTALPSLRENFPELSGRIAAGLVGNGSECFGYDDEISRDHDWGVDFFIWLSDEDAEYIPKLEQWKIELFDKNPPVFRRFASDYGAHVGILTSGGFYKSLIGSEEGPAELLEWVRVPEENLAMAVNGEVFLDETGEFTRIRRRLLEFFPEPLRLKRISSSCMAIAQSGQYNFARSIKRGDTVTARNALVIWSNAVIRLVFLLNRRYRPYYKWQFRMMTELPRLGGELADELLQVASEALPEGFANASRNVESVCEKLALALRGDGLSDSFDDFFVSHGER